VIARVDAYSLADRGRSSVHRAHFLDELLNIVPDGIAQFGKTAINIKQDAHGVDISFADGTTARASVAVCCDGIKSLGRQIVLGPKSKNVAPVFAGTYVYRTLVPRAEAEKFVDAGNGNVYCGQGGYIVMYPVDHGKLMNMVAVQKHSSKTWDHPEWLLPTTRTDMMKDFVGWGQPIIKLLDYVKETHKWALFNSPDAETYCDRRICLLGDSAHATTPHQGAGAGMGFEGAFVLSTLLGKMRDPARVIDIFKAYDAVRRPRTQRLVKTSREAGDLYNFELPGVGSDLKKINEVLQEWHEWIWKIDLPGQVKDAQDLLDNGSKL
jgi:salicylate hydroxylase